MNLIYISPNIISTYTNQIGNNTVYNINLGIITANYMGNDHLKIIHSSNLGVIIYLDTGYRVFFCIN